MFQVGRRSRTAQWGAFGVEKATFTPFVASETLRSSRDARVAPFVASERGMLLVLRCGESFQDFGPPKAVCECFPKSSSNRKLTKYWIVLG